MKRIIVLLLLLLAMTVEARAQSITIKGYKGSYNVGIPSGGGGGGGGGTTLIPQALGWYQMPSTTISGFCPSYSEIHATTGCSAVETAWGSGFYDSYRNAMGILGGGHGDYNGNELYKVSLRSAIAVSLWKDATHNPNLGAIGGHTEQYADGSASARHGYNGQIYLPQADYLFMYGGGLPTAGDFTSQYWYYDLLNAAYIKPTVPGTAPNPGGNGSIPYVGYDNSNGLLYFYEDNVPEIWQFNNFTNVWTNIGAGSNHGSNGCNSNTNASSIVDPSRHIMFIFGNNCAAKIVLSTGTGSNLTATGCAAIKAAKGPGLVFDPVHSDILMWAGTGGTPGNDILTYDPGTDACTTVTKTGGPGAQVKEPGAPNPNGTFGRLQYDGEDGVFTIANGISQNVWSYRRDDLSTTTAADWAAVCASPGVVYCNELASAGDVTNNVYAFPNSSSSFVNQGLDTTTYPHGGASYRFKVPISAGANASGSLSLPFGTTFGQNTTFYVQYRQRFSPEMMSNTYVISDGVTKTYWKQSIVHNGDFATHNFNTCGPVEQTIINYTALGFPGAYKDCGGTVYTPSFSGGTNFLLESGTKSTELGDAYSQGYNCHYQLPRGRCFFYPPNTWITFTMRFDVGTWGSANSHVSMWAATPGGENVQFENITTTFNSNPNPADAYNYITLTPYMTNRSGSFPAAADAFTWYCCVVVSTNMPRLPRGGIAAP